MVNRGGDVGGRGRTHTRLTIRQVQPNPQAVRGILRLSRVSIHRSVAVRRLANADNHCIAEHLNHRNRVE